MVSDLGWAKGRRAAVAMSAVDKEVIVADPPEAVSAIDKEVIVADPPKVDPPS